jgi:hypothetical protein
LARRAGFIQTGSTGSTGSVINFEPQSAGQKFRFGLPITVAKIEQPAGKSTALLCGFASTAGEKLFPAKAQSRKEEAKHF